MTWQKEMPLLNSNKNLFPFWSLRILNGHWVESFRVTQWIFCALASYIGNGLTLLPSQYDTFLVLVQGFCKQNCIREIQPLLVGSWVIRLVKNIGRCEYCFLLVFCLVQHTVYHSINFSLCSGENRGLQAFTLTVVVQSRPEIANPSCHGRLGGTLNSFHRFSCIRTWFEWPRSYSRRRSLRFLTIHNLFR